MGKDFSSFLDEREASPLTIKLMTLVELGWNQDFEKEFAPFTKKGWVAARLIRDNKITYGALTEGGVEYEVVMSGKVYHDAESDAALPAVGDWVALDVGTGELDHVIRARLSRQTCFSRKEPGKSSEEQVMAANVSMVCIVTDADADLNLRRMERFFALVNRSEARAIVLVNKSDLTPKKQNEEAAQSIRELNSEADVIITSAVNGDNVKVIEEFKQHL